MHNGLPPQVVNLTGGDLTSLENKPFVEAFVRQVLSPTEQGQFSRDGRLTKDASKPDAVSNPGDSV